MLRQEHPVSAASKQGSGIWKTKSLHSYQLTPKECVMLRQEHPVSAASKQGSGIWKTKELAFLPAYPEGMCYVATGAPRERREQTGIRNLENKELAFLPAYPEGMCYVATGAPRERREQTGIRNLENKELAFLPAYPEGMCYVATGRAFAPLPRPRGTVSPNVHTGNKLHCSLPQQPHRSIDRLLPRRRGPRYRLSPSPSQLFPSYLTKGIKMYWKHMSSVLGSRRGGEGPPTTDLLIRRSKISTEILIALANIGGRDRKDTF
ncbi:hypothetical protein BDK51DRAFT_52330 [Blyttiomyces helicus]|uniref:Uncharacterized protein n=1 Tax=Blyttiomyces helicus TaxID=388810 RepID=A0A4P9WHD1_9FUNG|nr:hypothetical protein BDK51DRAFT_52330 [Blyttiomyces helicus]|eukprot:RKO90818.1 hypothetical protein BDK51DRAFT_52330 [Blyttiomyces helicus]